MQIRECPYHGAYAANVCPVCDESILIDGSVPLLPIRTIQAKAKIGKVNHKPELPKTPRNAPKAQKANGIDTKAYRSGYSCFFLRLDNGGEIEAKHRETLEFCKEAREKRNRE